MRVKILAIFLLLSGCSEFSVRPSPSNCVGSNEKGDGWEFMSKPPQNADALTALLKPDEVRKEIPIYWLSASDGRLRFCQSFGEKTGAQVQDFEQKDEGWHLSSSAIVIHFCERGCRET